jgi:hypothetical protein
MKPSSKLSTFGICFILLFTAHAYVRAILTDALIPTGHVPEWERIVLTGFLRPGFCSGTGTIFIHR